MHHTIYFNQKPLVLTDNLTGIAENLFQNPKIIFNNKLDKTAIREMIHCMQKQETAGGVFLYQPVENLLQAFKSELRVIEAGGGLVHTDNGTILLIYRRGKWDLPKGKLDAGETDAEAALREVEEETGLKKLFLEERLTTTYHTYHEKGELILKESHWFLMKSEEQELVPQVEEDIERCIWVQKGELANYLENTHPSIKDVLKLGLDKLPTV
jgi:8-oxo-dGTP pyrophosphatase MutT (NUDIX family)